VRVIVGCLIVCGIRCAISNKGANANPFYEPFPIKRLIKHKISSGPLDVGRLEAAPASPEVGHLCRRRKVAEKVDAASGRRKHGGVGAIDFPHINTTVVLFDGNKK
jgi:hypothetical protein